MKARQEKVWRNGELPEKRILLMELHKSKK